MSNALFGQAVHTLTIINQQELTLDDLRVLHDGYLADLVSAIKLGTLPNRAEYRKILGLPVTEKNVGAALALQSLTVNYDLSLEAMIQSGRYDWVNSDITAERFPLNGIGTQKFEYKLFYFGRDISSKKVVYAIETEDKCNPWSPAKIEHLLAFGVQKPEEQRKYPIVGLGSVCEVRGHRRVAFLGRDAVERNLRLSWWDGAWPGDWRFLAVRKVSGA